MVGGSTRASRARPRAKPLYLLDSNTGALARVADQKELRAAGCGGAATEET